MQCGPGVAPKVVGLGPGLGDRDLDPAVVIQEVEDVGELRAAVPLDGGQDAPVLAGQEGAGPSEVHGQTMTQPAPEAPAACWQSSKRNSYLFFEDFFAAFFLPPAFFFAGTALTSLFGNSPGRPQNAVRRRRSRVSAT